jgi:hypothetical protein
MSRLDYASDTINAVAKGPLSNGRYGTGATGDINYGYWGGGQNPSGPYYSTVDRLDFSSDTVATSVKGPLSTTRWTTAATSGGQNALPQFGG